MSNRVICNRASNCNNDDCLRKHPHTEVDGCSDVRITCAYSGEIVTCIPYVEQISKHSSPYFEGVNEGDKVWDVVLGEGEVVRIGEEDDRPITVYFHRFGSHRFYTLDGQYERLQNQVLFWPGTKIISGPPPKRKRKIVVERWVNVYYGYDDTYDTKAIADECAGPSRIACIRLTGEAEVEE